MCCIATLKCLVFELFFNAHSIIILGVFFMYQEGFSSKLKRARQLAGFTQLEVKDETGIPRSTLANYETGRTQPDIENLGILADFYGVSIDWLVGTKGNQAMLRNGYENVRISGGTVGAIGDGNMAYISNDNKTTRKVKRK
jgi:DNA-binding XRE family transcriptional regulator